MKKAVQIEPNNPKAHYELGHCYNKFGIGYLADEEYQILIGQDEKLAAQLKKEIDNK